MKNLIDIIDITNEPNLIENIMGHRQDMTPEQRLKWDCDNYKKRLDANKGLNFEYWNEKHEKLLKKGWELFLITETSTRQLSQIKKRHPLELTMKQLSKTLSTTSVDHAKKIVEQLRSEGNYARIVCGYNMNKLRVKMYSIIYKAKV